MGNHALLGAWLIYRRSLPTEVRNKVRVLKRSHECEVEKATGTGRGSAVGVLGKRGRGTVMTDAGSEWGQEVERMYGHDAAWMHRMEKEDRE